MSSSAKLQVRSQRHSLVARELADFMGAVSTGTSSRAGDDIGGGDETYSLLQSNACGEDMDSSWHADTGDEDQVAALEEHGFLCIYDSHGPTSRGRSGDRSRSREPKALLLFRWCELWNKLLLRNNSDIIAEKLPTFHAAHQFIFNKHTFHFAMGATMYYMCSLGVLSYMGYVSFAESLSSNFGVICLSWIYAAGYYSAKRFGGKLHLDRLRTGLNSASASAPASASASASDRTLATTLSMRTDRVHPARGDGENAANDRGDPHPHVPLPQERMLSRINTSLNISINMHNVVKAKGGGITSTSTSTATGTKQSLMHKVLSDVLCNFSALRSLCVCHEQIETSAALDRATLPVPEFYLLLSMGIQYLHITRVHGYKTATKVEGILTAGYLFFTIGYAFQAIVWLAVNVVYYCDEQGSYYDPKACKEAVAWEVALLGGTVYAAAAILNALAVVTILCLLFLASDTTHRLGHTWISRFERLRSVSVTEEEEEAEEEEEEQSEQRKRIASVNNPIDITDTAGNGNGASADADADATLKLGGVCKNQTEAETKKNTDYHASQFAAMKDHLGRDATERYLFLCKWTMELGRFWKVFLVQIFTIPVGGLVFFLYKIVQTVDEGTDQERVIIYLGLILITAGCIAAPLYAVSHSNSAIDKLKECVTYSSPNDFNAVGGRQNWLDFFEAAPCYWYVYGWAITPGVLMSFLTTGFISVASVLIASYYPELAGQLQGGE